MSHATLVWVRLFYLIGCLLCKPCQMRAVSYFYPHGSACRPALTGTRTVCHFKQLVWPRKDVCRHAVIVISSNLFGLERLCVGMMSLSFQATCLAWKGCVSACWCYHDFMPSALKPLEGACCVPLSLRHNTDNPADRSGWCGHTLVSTVLLRVCSPPLDQWGQHKAFPRLC